MSRDEKAAVLSEVRKIIEKFHTRDEVHILWEESSGPDDEFFPCLNCCIATGHLMHIYVEDSKIVFAMVEHIRGVITIELSDPSSLDEDRILEVFDTYCEEVGP
jgi:hypothetical protein